MNDLAHILLLSDRFLEATGIKEVTLSHRIFGDSKKLTALREGADITVSRFNACLEWFSANWPDNAEWPSDVFRPQPEQAA